MLYRQITFAERYTLGVLRQRGLSAAAIARMLGRHRSTIGREVQRNCAHSDATYRPQLADWYARGRRSHSRRNRQFTAADWARIQVLLREDWSPEQVAGWLRRHRELAISHETIYRYVWADKRARHALPGSARGPQATAQTLRPLLAEPDLSSHSRIARTARGNEEQNCVAHCSFPSHVHVPVGGSEFAVRAQSLERQSLFVRQKVPRLPGVGGAKDIVGIMSHPSTVAMSAPATASLHANFIGLFIGLPSRLPRGRYRLVVKRRSSDDDCRRTSRGRTVTYLDGPGTSADFRRN
jgi:transposase